MGRRGAVAGIGAVAATAVVAGVVAVARAESGPNAAGVARQAAASDCRQSSVPEAPYVRANEALLRTVPVHPRAGKRRAVWTHGQVAADSCVPHDAGPPYGGYLTTYVYVLRKGTRPKAVLRFYDARLAPRWRKASWTACEASYSRRRAILAVSACWDTLMLKMDHRARR